jgi:hypothetical protein
MNTTYLPRIAKVETETKRFEDIGCLRAFVVHTVTVTDEDGSTHAIEFMTHDLSLFPTDNVSKF